MAYLTIFNPRTNNGITIFRKFARTGSKLDKFLDSLFIARFTDFDRLYDEMIIFKIFVFSRFNDYYQNNYRLSIKIGLRLSELLNYKLPVITLHKQNTLLALKLSYEKRTFRQGIVYDCYFFDYKSLTFQRIKV